MDITGHNSFSALLFSATFRRKVERLARDILTDPVRVVQGDIGEVNLCFFRPNRIWMGVDNNSVCSR